MKYLNSFNHLKLIKFKRLKWISLPSFSLILQFIFLNFHLVISSSSNSFSNSSLDSSLNKSPFFNSLFKHTSWPILLRSKRNNLNNNIFIDLESDQSIYHHPSPSLYLKKEFGQSDYWASIRRKWQQSESCPCQCLFDQLNRKVIKCDEQFTNITSIPNSLDPNVEVCIFYNLII